MGVKVGIDVAKHLHWVVALEEDGTVMMNRKLENTPAAIGELVGELRGLDGPVVGVDMTGGIAGLLLAMLAAAEVGACLCQVRWRAELVGARGVGRTRPIPATRGQ